MVEFGIGLLIGSTVIVCFKFYTIIEYQEEVTKLINENEELKIKIKDILRNSNIIKNENTRLKDRIMELINNLGGNNGL